MGVGVGVAASLIPTELSSKRDYYQRLTRIWQLLAFEINSIIAQCDSYDNHPEDQWAKVSELPSLPSIAWQVAMTNGVDAEPETLQELGIAYATLERLNATISCYTEFSGRGMLQGGYPGGCQSYNREFKEQCYNTVHLFKGLTGKVDSFISASQENAKKVQRQINGLGVFGVVMLILTVLLTCILTPTAFFH